MDKLGRMIRAKLHARKNDNVERKNKNSNYMVTPQFSTKYIPPQSKKKTKPKNKLPAIRKSFGKQCESFNKENIYPNDYCSISLNKKLTRKHLRAIPNGLNQSIDVKKTKLELPDDSNYEKIVNFVKDVKNTITEYTVNRVMTPCNEVHKKLNKFPRASYSRIENPHTTSIDPRGLITKNDENEKELKRLTLFPMMRLEYRQKELNMVVYDPFYII